MGGKGDRGSGGGFSDSGDFDMMELMSNSMPGLKRALFGRPEVTDMESCKAFVLRLPVLDRLLKACFFLSLDSAGDRVFLGGSYSSSALEGMAGASGPTENRSLLYEA